MSLVQVKNSLFICLKKLLLKKKKIISKRTKLTDEEKQEKIKEHLLDKLLDRFYKGSSSSLIMQLLGNKRTSKEDIEFLKEQLRKMK